MISPNNTLLFCKASLQGCNSLIIRLSVPHWDIPELSQKRHQMTISGCKTCPQAEWEETQEETYPHGQLAAAAAAGPCTSTALSISTPVGM